ncbi:MAG: P-loop NTPase [Tepidisphaeraceae bacterium]
MSQDLVRSQPRPDPFGQLATQADLWGSGAPSALAMPGHGQEEAQPLKVLHRSLRGRYHWALILGAAGALVGAALGWGSYQQKWKATGGVLINPNIPTLGQAGETMALYGQYMASQAIGVKSAAVIDRALQTPAWKQYNAERNLPDEVARGILGSGLTCTYLPNTYNLSMVVEASDPKLAKAACSSIVNGYIDWRKTDIENSASSTSIEQLKSQIASLEGQIDAANAALSAKAGLDDAISNARSALSAMEKNYSDAEMLLRTMEAMRDQVEKDRQNNPDMVSDDRLKALQNQEKDLAVQLQSLKGQLAPNHPQVRKTAQQLDALRASIADYRDDLVKTGVAAMTLPNGQTIAISPASIEQQKSLLNIIKQSSNTLAQSLAEKQKQRVDYELQSSGIDRLRGQLEEKRRALGAQEIRLIGLGAAAQPQVPTGATVSEDRRPVMATFGFVVGGMLPVLAVFMWGLADRKYRYSDETTQTGSTKGIPLLGILPNLPDRLSDPSQASVAAHCVHQIRTMLQLNVIGEDPSILCVTSATSGDGKTSLTLALGLSFAASGSRTLLIDTDIIGAGLSARLGVREPVGIAEAIVDRNPTSFIRPTDVAELSILPVGIGANQQAGVFTPQAVRRLFAEVRKHYDIILVDTGPVLGSIEATPLVAAADATILTVAKGQNRDLVEKAIAHLRQIGARIAGVVFNRAGARDFERSISGISLRSVSRQQTSHHAPTSNGHTDSNAVVGALSGRN